MREAANRPARDTGEGCRARETIHVLHVQESLEPGGLENGVVNLANGLEPGRFRTTICCLKRVGELAGRISNPQVAIVDLGQGPGKRPGLWFSLRTLIRDLEVDVVHTHNFYSGFYGVPAAFWSGRPVAIVHGEHGMLQHEPKRRLLLARLIYSLADTVLSVARDQERILRQLGIPAAKVRTILNGVDLGRFTAAAGEVPDEPLPAWAGRGAVIGAVGRLSPEKGHRNLLNAFALLAATRPEARLVLVGDGPARGELERLAHQKGMSDRVHFLGMRTDVERIYPLFNVFVLPSLSEGMPNALLEAMSAGLPIVATAVGEVADVVGEDAAVLVAPGSVQELVDAIAELLDRGERAAALGSAARRCVEKRFSLAAMIGHYEELYRSRVAQKRKAG